MDNDLTDTLKELQVPALLGALIPISWAILFSLLVPGSSDIETTAKISFWFKACVFPSILGGAVVTLLASQKIAETPFATFLKPIAMALCLALPIIALVCGLANGGDATFSTYSEKASQIEAQLQGKEKLTQVKNQIVLDHGLAPQINGWQPMPTQASIVYDLSQSESLYGPEIYTGINMALTKGSIEVEWPQCNGRNRVRMNIGEKNTWNYLSNRRDIPIHSWNALYVRGDYSSARYKPSGPFTVSMRATEDNGSSSRIATWRNAAPLEEIEWGVLPDETFCEWQLYIRIARQDGTPPPQEALSKHVGVLTVTNDKKRIEQEYMLALHENYYSNLTLPSGKLSFLAPNIPGGTRMEVILKITPKE